MSPTTRALTLALAALLIAPLATAAQDEQPLYVWVNFLQAQPGKGEALTGMMIEQGTKSYGPLLESGAAVNWGIAMNVVHDGGDEDILIEWISFRGWQAMDQFMQGFMASRQAMTAEERAAEAEAWNAHVVSGSHADMINRSAAIGGALSGRPGYIHLGYFEAVPGQEEAAMALWNDFATPALEKAHADGAIMAYGLHVPAVHRGQDWTHMSWYSSADLAARDAVDAAFAAAGDEETSARMAATFTSSHSDQILMVVHYEQAAASE